MKLSTARRLVCMSYFTVDGLRPLLATATRIVCSGDTKRFLFPDGSVIESTKGHWKVVGMEKNSKLEAAVRRFGAGHKSPFPKAPVDNDVGSIDWPIEFPDGLLIKDAEATSTKEQRLSWHVAELQKMLNQKDEQLDKANRPMVVRLDWWAVALVGLVLVAHYVFKVL